MVAASYQAYEAHGFVGRIRRSRHPAIGNLPGAIMKQEVIPVLDCGATNVRAIAVDRQGKIIARASTPNASDIAPQKTVSGISGRWKPFCNASPAAVSGSPTQLANCRICGIAVTTFGVDGALVDQTANNYIR